MRRTSLHATKVLWVGTHGYQRDCKVSLDDFNGMQVKLSLFFSGESTQVVHLQSIDGFRFIGKTNVDQMPFIVITTHYRHDDEYLFFGKWQHGSGSGECVIHANAILPNVKIDVRQPQLLVAA